MSNNDFSKQNQKLIKELTSKLNERADKFSVGLADALVDVFEHNARERLRSRATPKAGTDGQQLIENICNNITHEKKGYYSAAAHMASNKIVVLPDSEGLYMFLEYGTGVLGWFSGGHPEASKIGWEYMTNPSHYVLKTVPREGITTGLQGWFFGYNGSNYLDMRDEYPNVVRVKYIQTTQMGGGFTDKNGRHVRRYRRRRNTNREGEFSTFEKDYSQYNWAFSSGLQPLRYFYDTKMEIRNIIRELQHRVKSEGEEMTINQMQEFINSKKL